MLLADGRLVQVEGGYDLAGSLDGLSVPDTLTALIASRLDALDPAQRSLVHDAAVLGQTFTLDALGAVSGVSPADLEQRVGELIQRELLTREADARSPERGQLAFMQALIREVAYNTLAKRDRKTRHLAAARYFEEIGSDELAGALANHYVSAYRNAAEGPEMDALAAQARVALRGAAERAAALGSHSQAITFLQQALEVTNDDAERAVLLERAGDSARVAALPGARDYYEQASKICLAAGDRLGVARLAARHASSLLTERLNSNAAEFLEQAWAEYKDLWPARELIQLRTTMARAYDQLARYRQGIEVADEVLEAAEHAGAMNLIVQGMISRGASLGALGRLREAVAMLDAAERLSRDNGFVEELQASLLVGGFVRGEIDLRQAFAKNHEGIELARRTGMRPLLLVFVNNIGYTGFMSGDWDQALAVMEAELSDELPRTHQVWLGGNIISIRASRGEDMSDLHGTLTRLVEEDGEEELRVALLDAEANLCMSTGRPMDARAAWHAVIAFDVSFAAAGHYQAGRAALWLGDTDGLKDDLAAIAATGVHGPIADVRKQVLGAGLAALEGRFGEAVAAYRLAIKSWRDLGVVFEEAATGVDMAVALGPEHADQEIVRSTRVILERLGAKPYLARLEAALEPGAGRSSTGEPATAGAGTALIGESTAS
jgi:tetratricopeptide (TPR) repeat protein